LALNTRFFNGLLPLAAAVCHEIGELFWSHRGIRLDSHTLKAFVNLGVRHCTIEGGINLLHDVVRHFGRAENSSPEVVIHAFQFWGVACRWDVGVADVTLMAHYANGGEPTALDEFQQRRKP